ncbi:MAG: hypothetical protein R3250_14335, partial [Melioribacteraceae bacterium]|nr:hypothetical protein [Melioribacteraceae bacterium]
MKKYISILFLFPLIILFAQNAKIHHDLMVKIIPEESSIEVIDEISIDKELLNEELKFTLNDKLNLKLLTKGLTLKTLRESYSPDDIGMDRDNEEATEGLTVNEYSVSGFDVSSKLIINLIYNGKIESPLEQSMENYQRGFSESPGIISDLGVYLAGSTYWIPTVENEFVSFNLT